MRGYTADERDFLSILASGARADFDALTPEGARMDRASVTLVDRGCAVWRRESITTSFAITDLGRLAHRVARSTVP